MALLLLMIATLILGFCKNILEPAQWNHCKNVLSHNILDGAVLIKFWMEESDFITAKV